MEIEHDTMVMIADGEKFLLLRNVGDRKYMQLEVERHETSRNAPARELSTDRAGRRYDATRPIRGGVVASGKSGMSETDWHEVAEERFAEHVADLLNQWASEKRFERLVVIADPATLGSMRQSFGDKLRSRILAEIPKDLTNLPLDKIEASLIAYTKA